MPGAGIQSGKHLSWNLELCLASKVEPCMTLFGVLMAHRGFLGFLEQILYKTGFFLKLALFYLVQMRKISRQRSRKIQNANLYWIYPALNFLVHKIKGGSLPYSYYIPWSGISLLQGCSSFYSRTWPSRWR